MSPINPIDSANQIEMAVPAQDRQRMLTAKRRNPSVVGRNWRSGSLQFRSNSRVGRCRLFIHIEHPATENRFCQPLFVALPISGLANAISIFAQHNYRDGDFRCCAKNRLQCRIPIGDS